MVSSRVVETSTQVGVAAILLSLPFWAGDYNASQIGLFLLYGLATQSVALCWGRVGFLPLGQALFFGVGAYLSAIFLRETQGLGALLQIALLIPAIVIPGMIAYGIGVVIFAKRLESGPYFSLITLALCMLAYVIANRWTDVTGGFNGLTDVPDLPWTDRYGSLYYVIVVVSVGTTALLTWLNRRPIGLLWSAISQNEDRVQFFGFATHRLKAVAFGLSGVIAGLGGALYAPHEGIVSPQALSVALSSQFVIWAAVGGKESPLGAQLGAVLVGLLASVLRDVFSYWEVLVAVVFIAVVRLFPQGLAGLGHVIARLIKVTRDAPAEVKFGIAPPVRNPSMDASEEVLSFDGVRVEQAGVRILNGLDLSIDSTGISCLIGPNGAGKTSTFNAMTGRLPVISGSIQFRGVEISRSPAWKVARLGIGRKFQIPTVFNKLTVQENLQIAQWANRIRLREMIRFQPFQWSTPQRERMLLKFPMLANELDSLAGELSQGTRQMLEFAMVATTEPRLFLLDEPCAGLSADETRHMMDAIARTVGELGATAMVIEHDMSALERIADSVVVLHQGKKLAVGTLADIRSLSEVRAVYAGGRK